MRVFVFVFCLVSSEARRIKKPQDDDNEFRLEPKVDVYPQSFVEPVPFGHIGIEGYGDPFIDAKPPIDLLEWSMIVPKSPEEAMELRKQGSRIQFAKLPQKFLNAREMYLKESIQVPPEDNSTRVKWYQFGEMQRRNAMLPPSRLQAKPKEKVKPVNTMRPRLDDYNKTNSFFKNTFELSRDYYEREKKKVNWTTCSEFAVGAYFMPKDIVGINWVPFFSWSLVNYHYAQVYKFSYPPTKLVEDYKVKYGRFLNKAVDWNGNKILMTKPREMLLIAGDKKGLFDGIPKHDIPESVITNGLNITLPMPTLRMKLEDPYLVLMYCEEYFATVMAIEGTEPTKYLEMKTEAASIKFLGTGRPVWRDLEAEGEEQRLITERKLEDEANKVLVAEVKMPPADQYPTE